MMSLTAPASFVHVHTKSHLTDALSLVWGKYKPAIGGYLPTEHVCKDGTHTDFILYMYLEEHELPSSLSLVHHMLGGQSQMSGACAR